MRHEDAPFPEYPEYMNGRLKKIDMTSRLLKLKQDKDSIILYTKRDIKERLAAQQALNNALDVLDEYDY